ncbi:MAG: cytochrome P450 [Pseudomonadota bacterium]
MTAHSNVAAAAATPAHAQGLGEADSVWFTLLPLLKSPDNPMQTIVRMCEKYGQAIPLRLADRKIIFLSKPDHFKRVMVTHADQYVKYFDGLRPIFGKSMITIDGALWQQIRTPQQAAFHPAKFEEYLPFLLDSLRGKAARWEALAESGESVEMVEETWTLAADMICRALFDREMPFNPHFVFGCVKTYTDVQNHKAIRVKSQHEDDFSTADTSAADAMKVWAETPDKVIEAGKVDGRMSTLLQMMKDAEANPEFPEFDHQQVVDEMKQYLWAGTETTALTLAWCLYLLSQHPEVKEKVRAEAIALCGEDGEPDWEAAQNLTYTRMVIQETMRLYPPIWTFIREAAAEDEIDGVKIAPGDTIAMCSYAVHHNPEYWNDPYAFRPERFSKERMKARAKYSYLPFAAGKRSCIGGALSQLENALALAMLLRKFEPEYVGPVPAPIFPTVTLTPKDGLHFRIRKL